MKFQTFAIILLVLVGFQRADAQDSATTDLQRQVTELRTLVQQLQSRVSELEKNAPASATPPTTNENESAVASAPAAPRRRTSCKAQP